MRGLVINSTWFGHARKGNSKTAAYNLIGCFIYVVSRVVFPIFMILVARRHTMEAREFPISGGVDEAHHVQEGDLVWRERHVSSYTYIPTHARTPLAAEWFNMSC